MVARVLRDTEAGVGAALAKSPFLGAEHHRPQYLEGAVGRAGLVPARRVEPRRHVLRADAVERHLAERGQDAGVQVDAHGVAPRGLPVRLAAPQVLVRELPQGWGRLLPADVVGGIAARADAGEHIAGASGGLGKLHLAMPGDDDAAAPSLYAGLHNPDLPARRVDAQPEAGQRLVEQEGVLGAGLALAGQARGEVNAGHGRFLPLALRPFRPGRHGCGSMPCRRRPQRTGRKDGCSAPWSRPRRDRGASRRSPCPRRACRRPKPSCGEDHGAAIRAAIGTRSCRCAASVGAPGTRTGNRRCIAGWRR